MLALPPRYEADRRLGQGGGGEVWAVRDRVTGERLALKVLASDAGEAEGLSLVREAMALSGLEGLGLPRVVAFGALPDGGPRYMVRELAQGQSLEQILDTAKGPAWLEPLARASEQLTIVHRAGLLHGDIKPANIIVDDRGAATLVDLGLAAPWREGGTAPQGLTPRYAAPELFAGEPLTVRAEVYALGATLADGLTRRGAELDATTRAALTKIASRATERLQSARYPSVDELASALRRAAGLAQSPRRGDEAWPVVGHEVAAEKLVAEVALLHSGEALAVSGPRGSGKTTLARRLAWTFGVEGRSLATVEAPLGGISSHEAVELELGAWTDPKKQKELLVVIDDADALDDSARAAIRQASEGGARLIAVGSRDEVAKLTISSVKTFEVPPLAPE